MGISCRHITSLCVSFLLAFVATAQTARLYTTESGLGDTHINHLFQDKDGFMWVSSQSGLTRFDGAEFTSLHSVKDKDSSLGSDIVLKVFEDSMGTTWVGTSIGLQVFGATMMSFTDFDLTGDGSSRYVYEIEEVTSASGRKEILVSASQFGLYVIDVETHELLSDEQMALSDLVGYAHIIHMFTDSKGRLWASSELGGLSLVDIRRGQVRDNIWDDPVMQQTVLATSFVEDQQTGNIIIGTSNYGILIYDSIRNKVRRPADKQARQCQVSSLLMDTGPSWYAPTGSRAVLVGTENNGFKVFLPDIEAIRDAIFLDIPYNTSSWKIHSLLRDTEGNIWAGAYQKGLLVIPQSMFGFRNYNFTDNVTSNFDIPVFSSIAEDRSDGSLWAGTDGGGLFHRTGTGLVHYTSANSSLSNNSILALCSDKHGTLWVATFLDGLLTYTPSGGFKPYPEQASIGTEKTFCLCYDEEDDILYVGTHGGGLSIIQASTGKLLKVVCDEIYQWLTTLYLDSSGVLWMGTYNGAMRYDPQTGKVSEFNMEADGLSARILAISEDKHGTIWIGTADGLAAVKPADGKVTTLFEEDGLTSSTIASISAGDDGMVWVSTNNGLNRIDPATMECVRYFYNDGLQGNEFMANCVLQGRSGELYFGGSGGVTSFSPHSMAGVRLDVPGISLQRLAVNGQEEEVRPEIFIPHPGSTVSLSFSVPEYSNPLRIRLKYKMEGLDKDWQYTSPGARSINYMSLPSGRYTLQVNAFFDGEESVVSAFEIPVKVKTPFFLSWLALIMYVLIAGGFVTVMCVNMKHRRERKKEQEESDKKELKLQMFNEFSHEIGTPLSLIMSPLKALREEEADADRRDLYEMMYRNSLRIKELVGKIMGIHVPEEEEAAAADPSLEEMVKTALGRVNGRQVALVEHDADLSRYLAQELGKHFSITTFAKAEDAFAGITSSLPDAIVIDMTLDDKYDGVQLCERIKHNTNTNLIPVILLSPSDDDANVRRGAESGADRLMVKPITVDLLLGILTKEIGTREAIKNKYRSEVGYDYEAIKLNSVNEQLVTKVIDTIKANIDNPDFSVEDLSREVGMSRVHMNRKLKECMNTSPSNLIKSLRLKQAAYLLIHNKVNISEVAYKVGFSTHSYFSSSFHDYFGLTPKEFVAKYSNATEDDFIKKLFEA